MNSACKRIAIVGWEDGLAGLLDSWLSLSGFRIEFFVHPHDEPPAVTREQALRDRDASRFSFPLNGEFKGRPLYSQAAWHSLIDRHGLDGAIVALSDNRQRKTEIENAITSDINLFSAIHPSAIFLPEAILGRNVIVHASATVGYRAELHDGAIISSASFIDHHCVIRTCATISNGATLGGNVTVGECATVFAGAVVKQRVKIGRNSVIGAGAIVLKNVPPDETVVGNPASPIRRKLT
jgi:serine O-acetyltransferase